MSIGRATELWFSLEESGKDPLRMVAYRSDDYVATPQAASALSDVRRRWIESCLAFDEETADNVLTQAFALYPVTTVVVEVLQKGLGEIGNKWYASEATVQQEHFTSSLTIQKLDALLAAAPLPTRIGRILVACPPKEEHTIPLLILSLLLNYQGWTVVYLGANVPLARFDTTIDTIKPDLVVMAAQQLQTSATLFQAAKLLSGKDTEVAYGGLIFQQLPATRRHVPGFYLGDTIEEAVLTINRIMVSRPETPSVEPVPKQYLSAASDYRAHHALIEWDVRWLLETEGIPYEQMAATNARIADAIEAALTLGDLSFADTEVALGHQLMRNYGVSVDWQSRYFNAYYRAAYKHLHGDSAMVVAWLDALRSNLATPS